MIVTKEIKHNTESNCKKSKLQIIRKFLTNGKVADAKFVYIIFTYLIAVFEWIKHFFVNPLSINISALIITL